MVIKSDTLNELRKNATYSRQYAAALIAHAERIESLIEAEAMVADVGASQTPAEPARTESPAEPARTEPTVEPARTDAPSDNLRPEPAAEPERFEAPPAETPRFEAPAEAPRINLPAPPPPFPRVELELPKPNRDMGVTQADAIKTALRIIGRPASLGEIFNAIKSQRIPVKLTSAENLRLVMSRSTDFASNASGQWLLKTAQAAPDYTDQANAAGGSPEMAELATSAQG